LRDTTRARNSGQYPAPGRMVGKCCEAMYNCGQEPGHGSPWVNPAVPPRTMRHHHRRCCAILPHREPLYSGAAS
jgi:hypothetical protein